MLSGSLFSNKAGTAPNQGVDVTQPPDDSVSALAFSPATLQQNILTVGS